jgi:hypothetical protein
MTDAVAPAASAAPALQNSNSSTQAQAQNSQRAPQAPDPKAASGNNPLARPSPDPANKKPTTEPTKASSAAPKDKPEGDTQAEQKEAAAERRRIKVKVDGQEQELDEEEVVRDYQSNKAAQKRFAEAAALRKEAEQIIKNWNGMREQYKSNPELALEHLKGLGVDVDAVARNRAIKKLEWDLMTPQERQAHEDRRFREEHEKRAATEKQTATERAAQEKRERDRTHIGKQIDTHLHQVFTENGYDPSNPIVATIGAHVGMHMMASLRSPEGPIDAREAHRRVLKDSIGVVNYLIKQNQGDPAKLKALFPELFKVSRAASVAEAKRNTPHYGPGNSPQAQTPSKKAEPMTFREAMQKEYGLNF